MKKTILTTFILFALAAFVPAMAARAEGRELLIVSTAPINRIVKPSDTVLKTAKYDKYISAVLTGANLNEAIREYENTGGVICAMENIQAAPATDAWTNELCMFDDTFQKQLNNAAKYMEALNGLSRVKVAVIDRGFYLKEKDLVYNKKESVYLADQSSLYAPENISQSYKDPVAEYHGSQVAAVIGATRNNNTGIDGIAAIKSGRYLDLCYIHDEGGIVESSQGLYETVVSLEYIKQHRFDVCNMSFCFMRPSKKCRDFLDTYLKEIAATGCICVASAGNEGENANNYPAGSPYCIGVIGCNENKRDEESTYGTCYNISAPYEVTTIHKNRTCHQSQGTSLSAPIVSGIAAYVKMANPRLTFSQVKNILESTATDIGPKGRDKYTGAGKVNPLKAAQAAVWTNPAITMRTKPVYEYKKGSKYQYSAGKIKGWSKKRVAFVMPAYGKAVYRYYNKKTKTYRYSTKGKIKGWTKKKLAFYSGGSKKVYQAYNKKTKAYYYTRDYKAYKKLNKKWKKQGRVFYSY